MRHAAHMEDRRKLLGEHLREVRYAAGYRGRPKFAEVAGVAERSVSAVELGGGGRKVRGAMARTLGIDPRRVEDYLAGRTDELPRPAETNRKPIPTSPLAEIVAASEEKLDEFQRMFAKYRGEEEGRLFRAWADGVRAAHTDESGSVPHRRTESDAG